MLKDRIARWAFSRRAALLGGTALAAAGLVGRAQAQGPHIDHDADSHPGELGARLRHTPADVAAAADTGAIPMPLEIPLRSGTPFALTMKPGSFTVGSRQATSLRVYEGAPFGPTLRMGQTGDFQVTVTNGLPLNPDQAQAHVVNVPSQFNTTNLHTHGLHVSPSGAGDNIYLSILPAGTNPSYADGVTTFVGSFTYSYAIANHTPGTFWYHPHHHGSVAVQVASGAVGALIVEGGAGTIDAVPEIAAAAERVLLLQQIALTPEGTLPDFDSLWTGAAIAEWTVNGTLGNHLDMQPGEVQRWRIVNTGFQSEAKLALFNGSAQVPLQLIAMDGVNFTQPKTVQAVYLPPGGRADVMVKAPDSAVTLTAKVGPFVGKNAAGQRTGLDAGFEINGQMVEADYNGPPVNLFTVEVAGTPKPMNLPAGPFPAPLVPDLTGATPNATRYVNFNVTKINYPKDFPCVAPAGEDNQSYAPWACPTSFKFQINGELFCPGRDLFQPVVDTVEEYYVDSPGVHVFHIHVNPFLVTQVDGKAVSTPQWRDTMLVGPNGYRALTKYTDFTGTFPIHCHILDHEDVGMMTNVTVLPQSGAAPARKIGH